MAALLYYITDRTGLGADERTRRARLLDKIAEAGAAGLDQVQLRERDLTARELEQLGAEARARLRGSRTRLLINSRLDVALAVGAHGVHLRTDDISAGDARQACERAGQPRMLIAVSCHSVGEVARAAGERADFAVFGPVFQKAGAAGVGLARLREAAGAAGKMPVLALGGITLENAARCLAAGAAGIAGIRLFQEYPLEEAARALRNLAP